MNKKEPEPMQAHLGGMAKQLRQWILQIWSLPWVKVLSGVAAYIWAFDIVDDQTRLSKKPNYLGAFGIWFIFIAWIPFLIWARFKLAAQKSPPRRRRSQVAVRLLWISIAMGLLIFGGFAIYQILIGHMNRTSSLGTKLGVVLITGFGGGLGAAIGLIAYLIQLCRNQWQRKLTVMWAFLYGIPFLYWIIESEI